MFQTDTFQMRTNDQFREMLRQVSAKLQRNESDTIRFLVRNAFSALSEQEVKDLQPPKEVEPAL